MPGTHCEMFLSLTAEEARSTPYITSCRSPQDPRYLGDKVSEFPTYRQATGFGKPVRYLHTYMMTLIMCCFE
jgi:hypothetical protein